MSLRLVRPFFLLLLLGYCSAFLHPNSPSYRVPNMSESAGENEAKRAKTEDAGPTDDAEEQLGKSSVV